MPNMDGTGPFGDGRPGRGLGPCGRGLARGRGGWRGSGRGLGGGQRAAAGQPTLMDTIMQRLDDLANQIAQLRGKREDDDNS